MASCLGLQRPGCSWARLWARQMICGVGERLPLPLVSLTPRSSLLQNSSPASPTAAHSPRAEPRVPCRLWPRPPAGHQPLPTDVGGQWQPLPLPLPLALSDWWVAWRGAGGARNTPRGGAQACLEILPSSGMPLLARERRLALLVHPRQRYRIITYGFQRSAECYSSNKEEGGSTNQNGSYFKLQLTNHSWLLARRPTESPLRPPHHRAPPPPRGPLGHGSTKETAKKGLAAIAEHLIGMQSPAPPAEGSPTEGDAEDCRHLSE